MTKEERNRIMNKLPQPCRKDCPNRSPRCHANCPDWKEYEIARNKIYKSRLVYSELNNQHCEAVLKACAKRHTY